MGVLTWIIFGLVAGAIAKLIMPGNQNMGWLWTIILGIVGAYVGAFVGQLLGLGDVTGFNVGSMLLAVGGSLIVLWLYGMATKRN